ncbi:MAG TPA: hypothetical protein VF755_12720 [Catenuloplanes sp.]|jgi:hypothetical protein
MPQSVTPPESPTPPEPSTPPESSTPAQSSGPARAGALHPQPEIAEALQACRRAGLRVGQVPGRTTWGRVECPTGARILPVPLVSRRPPLHADRLMVFLAEHCGHDLDQH